MVAGIEGGAPPPLGAQGPGVPLSGRMRETLEPRFKADLGGVRIHADKAAQEAAKALRARAFALGNDIWLGPGESSDDVALIAHEVTHVLQGGGPVLRRAPAASPPAAPAPGGAPAGGPGGKGKGDAKGKKGEGAAGGGKDAAGGKGAAGGKDAAGGGAAAGPGAPGGAGGAGAIEMHMPEPATELSRGEKGRLGAVGENATKTADAEADLPPAEEQTSDARGAVTEPASETQGKAEEGVVAQLAERAPPSPEIEELCQKIYKAIRDKRPPDEDKLVDAKPQEAAEAAGGELNSSVSGDTQRVQGSYDEINQSPTGSPEQVSEPLDAPPDAATPGAAPAGQASPSAVPPEEVSLDADVADSAAKMEEAGMETEPAKLVQDGPIAEARGAHGELGEMAQKDPAVVLAEQQAALGKAADDMASLQLAAYQRMAATRDKTTAGTGAQKDQMVGTEEQMRDAAGIEAKRLFSEAQKEVKALLDPLPRTAMAKWEAGKTVLSTRFEQHLARVKKWIDERHEGVGGAIVGVWDSVAGLPDWVVDEYDAAEKAFGDGVCDLIREISSDVNTVVASCESIIDGARTKIADLFAKLPDSLQEWAAGEQARLGEQLDKLEETAHSTRDRFNRDLVQRAGQAVQEARQKIHELREAAGGLLGKIAAAIAEFIDDPVKFIINGLLKLVGIDPGAFWALVDRIGQVISDIADDPAGFANNLLAALGQGFSQFFDHFPTHLANGFFDWLFSGLGSVGVQIPADFSLKSIITFALQLMGITWDRIRRLLAKHIGEKNVALLEKAYEVISTLIEKGPEGIFEMIQDKLDPKKILDQVIEAGIKFLVEALVKVVSARILLMLNPVGAIAQAIEAIFRILKWVFENAARIFSLVETVVNGAAQLVAGNISGMAGAVEGALAKLIAPVIDFLADYVGLGDLPEKIAEVIKGFQTWVEGILDTVIGFLAGKAKDLLKALGLGGDEEKKPDGAAADEGVGETVPFSAEGEGHKLWIKVDGSNAVPMVASADPKPVELRLQEWDSRLHELSEEKPPNGGKPPRDQAGSLIASARRLNSETDKTAEQVVRSHAGSGTGGAAPAAAPAGAGAGGASAAVVADEKKLADILRQLFTLYGDAIDSPPLKVRFRSDIARVAPSAKADIEAGIDQLEAENKAAGGVHDYANYAAVMEALRAKGEGNTGGKVLSKPLLGTHSFGTWATSTIAVPALQLAAEEVKGEGKPVLPDAENKPADFVNRFKGSIHGASGAFVESGRALSDAAANFGLRSSAEDTMQREFGIRLRFGDDVHNLYVPKATTGLVVQPGGGFVLDYDTYGGAHFHVTLDASRVTRQVKGTGLKRKSQAGVSGRGYWTTAPGQVPNADLNAAHVVADRFLGSGYKSAFNLIPTSAKFNQGDMGDVEDEIEDAIDTNGSNEFELTVDLDYTTVHDPVIVAAISAAMPTETAANIAAKLAVFAAKVGPGFQRVLLVTYHAELYKVDTTGKKTKVFVYHKSIGPDLYLGWPL